MTAEIEAPLHLTERAQSILRVLVEHYLHDGQPVGSRTLSRDAGLGLSPATVRNVMSDLEELGFIHSPHTSAGRVPTVQGYRFFVDTLLSVKPVDELDVDDLRQQLSPGLHLEGKQLIERASALLSGVTDLASVVSIPRQNKSGLKHIEFIQLNERRVLVVMVMNNDEVENRIIYLDRDYPVTELTEMSNFLNSRLMGKDFKTVRDEIIREMKAEREHANSMMLKTIQVAEQVLDDRDDGDYVLMGETNLMDFAEMSTVGKLKHLFEAFHQKQEILHLLDRCVAADGIQIFIGNESGYEVLDEWSIVTAPYTVNGDQLGVLGVIGPTRMAYDRVIPIVDITARLLGSALRSD
ncbi:MAG: heat-inducible transcriptional repressor HrcA [Gammaproteobacteria bacterium]|nr:heat-inducible transcriptional repressor HrcA [Gammaproteobacteria bacterium]